MQKGAGLSWRFVAPFVAIILVVVIIGILYGFRLKSEAFKNAEIELSAIATLKVNEIARWRVDTLADGKNLAESVFLAESLAMWLNGGRRDRELEKKLVWRLNTFKLHYNYADAYIVDGEGNLLLSVGEVTEHPITKNEDLVKRAYASRLPVLSDLFVKGENVRMEMFVPFVADLLGGGPPVAIIVLSIDPQRFLFPLIQSWPTPSKSAETLLVERSGEDAVYLNELRHRNAAPLSLRQPLEKAGLPAAMAVKGQTGSIEGVDYRDVPVIGWIEPVPDSPWFLIAKVDKREIFGPVYKVIAFLIATTLSLISAIAAAAASFWWQERQREHARSEKILSSLNECLLSLGANYTENVSRITDTAGDLLKGDCALYNRIDGDLLCSVGMWHQPPGYSPKDRPEGHICYDVINSHEKGPIVVHDLPNTKYTLSDPNVKKYGLKTYIGYPVHVMGTVVGSLCVVFTEEREFSKDELYALAALAGTLALEEERHQMQHDVEVRLNEIQKLNHSMIGREHRIIDMKREVNTLLEELGRQAKYRV